MLKTAFTYTIKYLLIISAFVILLILNWRMWVKDREQEHLIQGLQIERQLQLQENAKMRTINADLRRRIESLKRGSVEMIEEEARDNFGMVGEGETYFDFKSSIDKKQ